jgi:DNA-binding NarL/FixJ family response regulator
LFAEAIGAALSEHGHQIVGVVSTATEAIENARRTRPDFVLLELSLVDWLGTNAGRAILLEHPTVRIVVVAPAADLGTIQATVEAGFHGYITTESGIVQLVDAMRAIAAGNTVLPNVTGWEDGLDTNGADELRRTASLTKREREVLRLLAEGVSTREIARRLHIAAHTVRSHIQSVFAKLEVHSRLEAVAIARRTGLARAPSKASA